MGWAACPQHSMVAMGAATSERWSPSQHHQKHVGHAGTLTWPFLLLRLTRRRRKSEKCRRKTKERRQKSRRRQRRRQKSRRRNEPSASKKVNHKRACSDTIEETSPDEAFVPLPKLRNKRESQNCTVSNALQHGCHSLPFIVVVMSRWILHTQRLEMTTASEFFKCRSTGLRNQSNSVHK